MQEWTINNVSLADLGVDSLQLHIKNQDDDYVDIRFPRNYDAALPDGFDVDAPLVVRCGSTVVFRGEVATPLQSASAFAEYRSVFAYGPWHRFREMPFLYLYPYVTGAALSTHGVLGGNASDLLNAILTTNTDGIVQVGTIDVGSLVIPETEVYDQTLAQALQAVLRYITGAVVAFDYSTAPPTVHIVADNSTSLTSVPIDINDGLNSAFNLSPLYARLISGVTLQYEATGNVKDGVYAFYEPGSGTNVDTTSSPTSSEEGFYLLGTDSSGDTSSRRHFRRTMRLNGSYDVTRYTYHGQIWPYYPLYSLAGGHYTLHDLVTAEKQSGHTSRNLQIMYDRAMFFRYYWQIHHNFYFPFSDSVMYSSFVGNIVDTSLGALSDMTGAGSFLPHMRFLMPRGPAYATRSSPVSITSAFKDNAAPLAIPSIFLQTSSESGIRAMQFVGRWNFSRPDIYTYPPGYVSLYDDSSSPHWIICVDSRTIGSVNSSTGRFSFVKTVNNSSHELPSSGIAAQLLAANSRLLYEGRLTRLLDDPSEFAGLNRKVLFTNLAVSALVQRLSYDTATGLADLTFGAPTHLGPQDLIALQRAGKSPA